MRIFLGQYVFYKKTPVVLKSYGNTPLETLCFDSVETISAASVQPYITKETALKIVSAHNTSAYSAHIKTHVSHCAPRWLCFA